jgi:hypothetical protein
MAGRPTPAVQRKVARLSARTLTRSTVPPSAIPKVARYCSIAAADYVAGPYPATLEAAVLAGEAAALAARS